MLGRDLFMFGNFEDEDYDEDEAEGIGWDLPNTTSAQIYDYNPHEGQYCLRLRRHSSHSTRIEADSRWRMPVEAGKAYMLSGWYRTVNAVNMSASVRFYNYPWYYPWGDDYQERYALQNVSGDDDWTYFEAFFTPPSNALWAVINMGVSPPYSGDYGYAYFDEIRFVEWDQTTNPSLPMSFANPGNRRYIGLRTSSSRSGTINLDLSTFDMDDSDGDGLYDCLEDINQDGIRQRGETDPLLDDSDLDGLADSEEYTFGIDTAITNAADPDTDGDGYDDYREYLEGTDPNDDQSHPTGPTSTPAVPTQTPIPPTSTHVPATNTPDIPTHTPTIIPSATPSFTPTPTSTLHATFTAAPPTDTPASSFTPTPTAPQVDTATPSPTPSPTPPHSSTATATPPVEPTATESPSATETPGVPVYLEIRLPGPVFHSGETCYVNLWMENRSDGSDFDLYFLLDIEGSFWCYPSWTSLDEAIDFQRIQLPGQSDITLPILPEFVMPMVPDAGPFYFYAVCFEPGTLSNTTIQSNIDFEEFYLGS